MTEKRLKGRPSKYDEKYCEDIVEYFESFIGMVPPKCPLFEVYAANIAVHRDTLQEWSKVHEKFSVAYSKARSIQLDIMVNNGFIGVFNPGFTKFAMQNMHGWKDKQEVDNNINANVKIKTIEEFLLEDEDQ